MSTEEYRERFHPVYLDHWKRIFKLQPRISQVESELRDLALQRQSNIDSCDNLNLEYVADKDLEEKIDDAYQTLSILYNDARKLYLPCGAGFPHYFKKN